MKKSLLSTSCAVALLLSACVKRAFLPPGNTINYCPITSMTFNDEYNFTDTLTFYYNPDGSPSHIDRAFVDDGSPKFIFRYDSQGRLLDYIGALNNGSADFWTRFYYDEATRTVIDTSYSLAPQYQTWPPNVAGGGFLVEKRQLDPLGRIISYAQYYVTYDTTYSGFSDTYTYNRAGDLAGLPYDNKINFNRTNAIWQFLDLDYSTHNLLPAQQYNNFGLPTEFNFNIPGSEVNIIFLDLNYPDFTIHYGCGAPTKEGGR
jgi:TPR repeat protein